MLHLVFIELFRISPHYIGRTWHHRCHLVDAGYQGFFYFAHFIVAVLTPDRLIGASPETLRMCSIDDLPPQRNDHRHEEQAPAEEAYDKQHWRIHHQVAPVEDPAADAAAIAHDVFLERTEEHHTDRVRSEVEQGQHEQLRDTYDPAEIKDPENSVETRPDHHDLPGPQIHRLNILHQRELIIPSFRLPVGVRPALKTAHRDADPRQKMYDHPQHQDHPKYMKRGKTVKKRRSPRAREGLCPRVEQGYRLLQYCEEFAM